MVEFTGERVIPGQVDPDLWNEHFSRYAFAATLAAGKRVLDAGCGTGYGTAELSTVARTAIGVDVGAEAIEYARSRFPKENLRFMRASCDALPFRAGAFDLIAAFEVIEHLADHAQFVRECGRVLHSQGMLIVSTPNRSYYADSRARSGPNPFHAHEFEADEFVQELYGSFAHVNLFLQNRAECFAFAPPESSRTATARMEGGAGSSDESHFLVALCGHYALPDTPAFVHVPRAANLLREREQHVQLLERQVIQKDTWLAEARREHGGLLALHEKLKEELEQRNRWAAQLNDDLRAAGERISGLQDELKKEQAAGSAVALAYEEKVRGLETENAQKTAWAQETESRLSAEAADAVTQLSECVRLLDAAERTVEERTRWAQQLDRERETLAAQLASVRQSRWVKLGRTVGLGPVLR